MIQYHQMNGLSRDRVRGRVSEAPPIDGITVRPINIDSGKEKKQSLFLDSVSVEYVTGYGST